MALVAVDFCDLVVTKGRWLISLSIAQYKVFSARLPDVPLLFRPILQVHRRLRFLTDADLCNLRFYLVYWRLLRTALLGRGWN